MNTAIKTIALDLSGPTVLTEVASDLFALTPLIAALANAERVVVIGRDSRHGLFQTVKQGLFDLAGAWSAEGGLRESLISR